MTTETQRTFDYSAINSQIITRLPALLAHFSIEYTDYENWVAFSCPIHKSQKDESASIFRVGEKRQGNFICWTNHCEEKIGYTAYSFFKFLFNKDEWSYNEWLTSKDIKFKSYTESDIELINFNSFVRSNFNESPKTFKIQTKDYVRNKLIIPCDYFLKRGYSSKVLSKFDVGLCVTKGSSAYMRAVVPVYDDTGKLMIGYTARSINSQCAICNKYHYYKHPCPRNKTEEGFARKWRHSEGFSSGSTLYNLWNFKGDTAVLVEGTADVWRLEEAGCFCGLSLFGCSISDKQIQKLVEHGVNNIVLCLDNDAAGIEGASKIYDKLKLYFNIDIIKTVTKDIGDTPIIEVQNILKGSRWKLLE